MHESIFNLVTFGKGGWTWEAVYNMPVYLRTFYMQKMSEVVQKENEAATGRSTVTAHKAHRPNIQRA